MGFCFDFIFYTFARVFKFECKFEDFVSFFRLKIIFQ